MDLPRFAVIRLALALCLTSSTVARACQIPVFRYALERWAPAEYLITIQPAKIALSDAEQKAAAILRAAPRDAAKPANLDVQTAQPVSSVHGAALFTLDYPHKLRDAQKDPIWWASLNEKNVHRLLDSPARRELRRRLLAGQSAIWLLVESGDPAKDDAAAKAMTDALAEAQASLKLPDGVVTPSAKRTGPKANEQADTLRSDLPLKIEFSLLRVQRNDPEEAALLAMLTHLEDDLGSFAKEPMVFPVFGRGRVLEPLIGAGINKENVLEHSTYLCGACSCEIKDQNPGIDLLITANWEPVDTTPQLEIVRITPRAAALTEHGSFWFATAGCALLLLTVAVWLLHRKPC